MEQVRSTPLVLRPGEGEHLWSMGALMSVLLSSGTTGGEMSAMEVRFPAGTATPLHIHRHESELNYVLEGEMRFQCGEERYDVGPGSLVFVPRGEVHAFRVLSEPCRMLAVTTPAGIEGLYRAVGRPADEFRLPGEGPNVPAWLQHAPEFGIEVVGPPIS